MRTLLLVWGVLLSIGLQAQPSEPLVAYASERTTMDRRGMLVLGSWAVSNIGASGVRYFATQGSEKYFHQMNVGWGIVNLALAGAALRAAQRPQADTSRPALVKAQLRTETLYLFNAGLDAAYVATGFYLRERARSRSTTDQQHRLHGYGQSLLLQGGFLLVFDGVMFGMHHRHARQLYPLLSRLQVGPGTVALALPIR